ncbi:MAG: hypothetical protein IKS23_01605 [Alphaproteobacteria bacterium]|nr:hypothetical protein [Alphaproteobacteria bacterium]
MSKTAKSFWNMVYGFSKNQENQKDFTPTYLEISKNLNSKDEQVFQAAVYSLCVVANQKKEYQSQIVALLTQYLKKSKAPKSRISYIKKMMEEQGLN